MPTAINQPQFFLEDRRDSGSRFYPLHSVHSDYQSYGGQKVTGYFDPSAAQLTYNTTNSTNLAIKKEPAVANKFDRNDDKNTALGKISSAINQLEAALFTRNRRIEEVKLEQDQAVAKASLNLDSVLAQAIQEDVNLIDLETHFDPYADNLEHRFNEIISVTELDNADVLV